MRKLSAMTILVLLAGLLLFKIPLGQVSADGSEVLGPPSVTIASGSGIVAAGTGLITQPGSIAVDVPLGATVTQVLLYWEGHHTTPNGDDTITVEGFSVPGILIGGPNYFFYDQSIQVFSSSYRADITSLDLVGPGSNTLAVAGLSFDYANDGAGILVIYDDGSSSDIQVRDGNDLAYYLFAPPRDTTVPQTFYFEAADYDRTAQLSMFFSSISGTSSDGDLRPSVIEVTVGSTLSEWINLLDSLDGEEWDTVTIPVDIPAGQTSLTVQALSEDRLGTGAQPASFAWTAASFSVPLQEMPQGEGCTPGYWKQKQHFDSWVSYSPGDDFGTVFGVTPSVEKTLLQALGNPKGNNKVNNLEWALGRHAVAALLNATNPDVSYFYSEAEVIAIVQDAYASGDFGAAKDLFELQNEIFCPLD